LVWGKIQIFHPQKHSISYGYGYIQSYQLPRCFLLLYETTGEQAILLPSGQLALWQHHQRYINVLFHAELRAEKLLSNLSLLGAMTHTASLTLKHCQAQQS